MLQIDKKPIGQTDRPYIIAEMACAHCGKFDYAIKLIDIAARCNADAIQLQIFTMEEMMVETHEAYELVKDIEFTKDEWKKLIDHARKTSLDIIVFAYDNVSLKFAIDQSVDAIKFNSSDLLNIDMLETVGKAKIPFLLHTGSSSIDEISQALNYVRQFDCGQTIIMHGVQNFPTHIDNANISRVKLLKDIFKLPTGYDDHTEGGSDFSKIVDLVAIGIGADVLEKHIQINRAEKGIDYVSALEEHEFKEYVEKVHLAARSLGKNTPKEFNESDFKYRRFQKKSIVAIRDINEGDVIKRDDFKFLRNKSVGLQPIDMNLIIDKKAKSNIQKYENIELKDLE